ncbi:hypothetical protein C1H46_020203 [Malus baccata]|uniref:Uncharacterized protein n=1 Tax=Malus baccata TaxID=106549 RepID=A0A540M625_MALBA|nr:hypothetical protein C1H46_020203 [Malus baccata]
MHPLVGDSSTPTAKGPAVRPSSTLRLEGSKLTIVTVVQPGSASAIFLSLCTSVLQEDDVVGFAFGEEGKVNE